MVQLLRVDLSISLLPLLSRRIDHIHSSSTAVVSVLVLSVPSGEVLLEVRIVWLASWLEEVRILLSLAVECLALVSMETTVRVSSKLSILILLVEATIMGVVVESSETILLMVASCITCIVTLVLLKGTVRILGTWNVVTSEIIITSSELIISILVEVEALWVEETTSFQDVEVIFVITSWSILDFLTCVFLDSGHRLQLRVDWMGLLVQHGDVFLTGSVATICLLG